MVDEESASFDQAPHLGGSASRNWETDRGMSGDEVEKCRVEGSADAHDAIASVSGELQTKGRVLATFAPDAFDFNTRGV